MKQKRPSRGVFVLSIETLLTCGTMVNMKKTLIWILILSPLIILLSDTGSVGSTIIEKVLLLRIVAFVGTGLLCLMAWSSTFIKNDIVESSKRLVKNPMFIAATVNIGLLCLSTLFAFDRYIAFFGELTRGEGLLTILTCYVLFVYMLLVFHTTEWNKFFATVSVTGIVLFVVELSQMHRIDRPYSLVGNTIFLAAVLLFVGFAGYYFIVQQKKTGQSSAVFYGWIILLMSAIGIIFTKTRGTLVGIAVGTLVFSLVAVIYGRGKTFCGINGRKLGLIIGGLIISFIVLFGATYTASIWKKVPGLNRVATTDVGNTGARLTYLRISGKGFMASTIKQKIFGWGWDNYAFFWNKNYDPTVYFYDVGNADPAHNKLADELIMGGLVGLISYIALWFVFFAQTIRITKHNFSLGLGIAFLGVSYFVHNLFIFDSPETMFLFYSLLAFVGYTAYEK